ncbi:MAG: membrane dipeptidase [Bacteroidetes bacterium]|nr:membrane dipeptidase [Bacteroidota bacterium]
MKLLQNSCRQLLGLTLLLVLGHLIGYSQSTNSVHRKAILVDTHNDCLSEQVLGGRDISQLLTAGHSDYVRWKRGGVDIQFFSVFTGETPRKKEGFYQDALQEIDSLHRIILRHPDKFDFAIGYKQARKKVHRNKVVAMIGVEGGHMIESDLSKLDSLIAKGMSYMTLTWNNSHDWATSAMDESGAGKPLSTKGLTEFGKQVVKRMNEEGVIVDLSHVGEKTFYDVLEVTTKPVLLTHSSVWSLCPVFRNAKDQQIQAVAKNGGVICINFYPAFISKAFVDAKKYWEGHGKDSMLTALQQLPAYRDDAVLLSKQVNSLVQQELSKHLPGIKEVVDHIDYVVNLVGVNHVGIGADYDGIGFVPNGLEDVSTYPQITAALKRRGYSNQALKKILGGNVLRVLKANKP